jgi:hypothetical protein
MSDKGTKPYKNVGKGKLGYKMKRLNERRNAHSQTIRQVKNPSAFRTPGSMKGI